MHTCGIYPKFHGIANTFCCFMHHTALYMRTVLTGTIHNIRNGKVYYSEHTLYVRTIAPNSSNSLTACTCPPAAAACSGV